MTITINVFTVAPVNQRLLLERLAAIAELMAATVSVGELPRQPGRDASGGSADAPGSHGRMPADEYRQRVRDGLDCREW